MAYSDVKTSFLQILNRNDITPNQLQLFLQMGARRISREMMVPAMEKIFPYTTDGTFNLPLPNDYLEMISLNTNDAVNNDKLSRCNLQKILVQSQYPGVPKYYYRNVNALMIGPVPPAGTVLYLSYYADASNLGGDTDANWLTESAPDLLYYAGLTFAADFFLDERSAVWEAKYQSIRDSLINMTQEDELVNAQIGPAYTTNFDQYYPFASY